MILPFNSFGEQSYPNLYELNKRFKESLDKGEYEDAKKLNSDISCLEKAQTIIKLLDFVKSLEAENKVLSDTIVRLRNQISDASA